MTQEWSSAETLAYIGDKLKLGENEEGACRDAFMVEYVNQEEPMGRYFLWFCISRFSQQIREFSWSNLEDRINLGRLSGILKNPSRLSRI